MRIVIRLKSGFEMITECEEAEFRMNNFGELSAWSMKGIKGCKPIFFRSEDVECVYRLIDEEESE